MISEETTSLFRGILPCKVVSRGPEAPVHGILAGAVERELGVFSIDPARHRTEIHLMNYRTHRTLLFMACVSAALHAAASKSGTR